MDEDAFELCVLASGSAGNCSVLSITRGGVRRLCLIDLGLSPRRTVRLLAGMGLGLHQVDDVVLTHLDADHFCESWKRLLPAHVRFRLHWSHAEELGLFGLDGRPMEPFGEEFELRDGTPVRTHLASHDARGVATLRFELGGAGGESLGFATDVGRATDALVEHLRGVRVLAIESNYCPRMQEESGRPEYLKRRIMGGAGHLSNHEAVEAVGRISAGEAAPGHVVLLHLSRECNDPDLVAGLHRDAPYAVTITNQHTPTGWVRIGRAARPEVIAAGRGGAVRQPA